MTERRVLIAAAGKGTRAGLPYPKTLFPVYGKPILVRICELFRTIDTCPTIIVSPSGRNAVAACLAEHRLNAFLIEQVVPKGMGDAVLQYRKSPAFGDAKEILLLWGDIPFVRPDTVTSLIDTHRKNSNDFTFVTAQSESAYTVVTRDMDGCVQSVVETRENVTSPQSGERDIGLFLFRKEVTLPLLEQDLPGRYGAVSGEHGFLYIIGHLVQNGYRVEGLPIASQRELISLNRLSELAAFS